MTTDRHGLGAKKRHLDFAGKRSGIQYKDRRRQVGITQNFTTYDLVLSNLDTEHLNQTAFASRVLRISRSFLSPTRYATSVSSTVTAVSMLGSSATF